VGVLVLYSDRELWDSHIDTQHLRDMALHIWGNDSGSLMKNFEPNDSLLMKYRNSIADHEEAIRGKRVLDLGCNHGLYSYAAMRHGASHVVGVEPRGMFVDGLNSFTREHKLPMEFHKAYDTELHSLVREHRIETVIMMGMDTFIPWEDRMLDIRRSDVEWVILQMTSLPDSAVQVNNSMIGDQIPFGFTLHVETHNVNTRAPINPLHKDKADPHTGFQHLDPDSRPIVGADGGLDLRPSVCVKSLRSRKYIRKFLEHTGFVVEKTKAQSGPTPDPVSTAASHGLYQWFMLRNKKG